MRDLEPGRERGGWKREGRKGGNRKGGREREGREVRSWPDLALNKHFSVTFSIIGDTFPAGPGEAGSSLETPLLSPRWYTQICLSFGSELAGPRSPDLGLPSTSSSV